MVYLDNAATSFPKPEKVYREVLNCMRNYAANPGRGSYDMSEKASQKIMECRLLLSSLFNIQNKFNIVFTYNTTDALNTGIKGVLKKGDHVISSKIEHNSVLRPLFYLSKHGIDVTLVDTDKMGYINPDDIKKEIKPNTKLIVVTHASNVIGSVQDINEIGKIAKENGITFMVDAAQSAGIIPIDVVKDNIDLLAFPGHKGLLGPQGTGGLYIKDENKLEELKQGGTGSNSNHLEQPDFTPDKFESGTLNTPGIAGLCEGVKFILSKGVLEINKHEHELTEYLLSELKKMNNIIIYGNKSMDKRCGVVSINLDGIDSSKVGYLLNLKGISVRTGYHCAPLIHHIIDTENRGTVRISVGYFNTFRDIEKLISALKNIDSEV